MLDIHPLNPVIAYIKRILTGLSHVERLEQNDEDKNVMDPGEFQALLSNPETISRTDLVPVYTPENFLKLGGWKLNVTKTIFEDAKAGEVLIAWEMLSDLLPMDLYSFVFFLRTAYENVKLGLTYEEGFETDLLELLRLAHWYYKCSKVQNIDFKYKKSELSEQLSGEISANAKKYSFLDPDKFRYELSEVLPIIISTRLSTDLYDMTNRFREKVSSFVSEFMIAALAAEYNFAVRFKKKVSGEKNFDMFIQEIPCEVETILDQIPWAMQPASDVRKEILGSLKREKMIEKILDGLR